MPGLESESKSTWTLQLCYSSPERIAKGPQSARPKSPPGDSEYNTTSKLLAEKFSKRI
jgi:hypothetical protein